MRQFLAIQGHNPAAPQS
jgi:hypothetical protein